MSMLQHSTFSRLFYGGPSNNSSSNSYVNIQPVPVAAPERSHSPHSVDGSNPRPKRKNRERRGTENSLPVSFDAVQVAEDLQPDKDEATTPTAKKEPKRPKMEPSPDFQVPFPQVQDAARAKRDQLLRSPTLSAHSNTSSSHAPTASTANTTASGLTIPGAYDSGSGGSGVEVTPTRETVKVKRGSGSSVNGGSNPSSQAGFYQQLPPNPSPGPVAPTTGSPQAQPRTSPSQAPRQPYAPPPPAPTMSSSTDSFDAPTLSRSYTTTTTSSLPTLPDSPPPEPKTQPAPLTLTTVANLLQSQPVPISPVHPRPMNRTAASVLGPTKMAESWTAGPPPEDLADEVQERKAHLTSARDGAAVRTHRPGGSLELKDVASWAQGQSAGSGPERQASVRRPKVVTQSSTGTVVQSPPQPITRTATMPITTRYETTSPPPMRDHHGLHLELHDKPPPAPAPARVGRGPSPSPNSQGVGASPGNATRRAATPNNARGRAPGPAAMTPPYTYDDQYRNRSGSHASSYSQPKPPVPAPPPPPAAQWTGTGIVPFNEDLDHDDHDGPDCVVDWANHTQSQQPHSHPNQPTQQPPSAGRSRSRGREQNAVAQPPLMDPGAVYSQQQQGYQQGNTGYQHGSGYGQQYPQQQPYPQQQQPYPQQQQQQPYPQQQPQQQPYPPQQPQPAYQQQRSSPEVRSNGGRSPAPPAHHSGGTGSGSSETEDLKTPRSPSVPLPGESYGQRFGYNHQFSVGPPTVNHIYTQDLGPNGQMYPSMGFAQSQYALQQMGAGPQGMGMGMGVRQVNGAPRDQYNYGYPQDLSSSASGSFLDGWTSNQMDGRGYPNHVRPSAPVPPTPSSATAPTSVSGDIRNGQPAHMARAQTVVYNGQQQQYPPYNYAQAQMSYAMDPYRAPSVVSSFMASPFSHNPFLPPVEPQSTASSPSHQPIGLPFAGPVTTKRFGGARMGTKSMGRRRRMMQEFRPESTVPNDTASEAETEAKRAPDGAETEFETETEMEEVWLEESDDDELDNEYHPTYFVNPAKRKRRFEQKWEQMVKLFREIDRETDATMILAAAPPDQHQTHLLLSRAILRDTNYSHIAQEARSVFSDITVARRHERTETLRRARQDRQRKKAIDDRLASVAQLTLATQQNDNQVGSGSDETSVPATQSGPGDQDLRLALDAARSSLQEMRRVYDEMETRHREESARRKEESLSLEKLLTSLLSNKAVQQSS